MSPAGTPPSIAVLVLNLNGKHFLDECFQSLLRITKPCFDIYLIDNHSSDSSVQYTRAEYPMIIVIENERNYGFAGAYDRVIRELDHDYVVLLNNDTKVDENWLAELYTVAESSDRVAACGSKIVTMWDNTIIDHAGGMLTLIGSGHDLGKWTKDPGGSNSPREIGFGCGCSLLIRRDVYLEVGGFDPGYIIYHEDVDLCWKMRLFGYSVMYVPDSVVYHHLGGGTIQSIENPWKAYLCQKNRLANIIKNMGPRMLVEALFVSLAYDTVRAARYIVMRRGDLLKMLLKGYVTTLRNLGRLMSDRGMVQHKRKVSDKELRRFFHPLISSALEYRRLVSVSTEKPGRP
ncbi:MAG: glycosyltransferase family 2 protein [Desulfomonilaceae bacterium]|nr:glycosyltransferase family 2 protein [Desulfomonilaceae bacterium]